jgi:hypothetical protein
LLRKSDPNIDPRALRERAEEGLIAGGIAPSGMRSTVTDNLAHAIALQRLNERDVAQMGNASSSAQLAANIGQNPVAALAELTASISNFGAVVGGPLMGPAAKALDSLARSIEDFTSRLQKTKGFWPSADDQKTYHAFSGPSPDAAIADLYADRRPLSPGGPGAGGWDLLNEWRHPLPEHQWGPWHAGGSPTNPIMPQAWTPTGTALSGGADNAKLAAASAMPVTVSGQATVEHTVHLDVNVTLDPSLRAKIDQIANSAVDFTVPLAGGGVGRMDSDAAPHRTGGIGSM